jgi:hypothetical protein
MLTLASAATLYSLFVSFTAVNLSDVGRAWLVTTFLYAAWWMG